MWRVEIHTESGLWTNDFKRRSRAMRRARQVIRRGYISKLYPRTLIPARRIVRVVVVRISDEVAKAIGWT